MQEGDDCIAAGDAAQAKYHYETALQLARDVDDRDGVAVALLELGSTHRCARVSFAPLDCLALVLQRLEPVRGSSRVPRGRAEHSIGV